MSRRQRSECALNSLSSANADDVLQVNGTEPSTGSVTKKRRELPAKRKRPKSIRRFENHKKLNRLRGKQTGKTRSDLPDNLFAGQAPLGLLSETRTSCAQMMTAAMRLLRPLISSAKTNLWILGSLSSERGSLRASRTHSRDRPTRDHRSLLLCRAVRDGRVRMKLIANCNTRLFHPTYSQGAQRPRSPSRAITRAL